MEINILGTGCPRCKALEKAVKDSLEELKVTAYVSKVDDIVRIMEYGVMHTPALVINNNVVLSGRIPSSAELKEILTNNN
ncbi:MAG: TM0996/MTH895 family glutaredoxin-like protein [Bacteroidales bacterium]|nr:TM0996/MTH895 family glutaredoxin-like protein [Bacteroidales bacterium]